MNADQRHAPRLLCHARLLGATSELMRGELVDVSSAGACLSLERPVTKGRELFLDLALPWGSIEAVAEVRWVERRGQRFEVGVRFTRIDHEAREMLERSAANQQPLSSAQAELTAPTTPTAPLSS